MLSTKAGQVHFCTNLMRGSFYESRVVAGIHEQAHTPDLQHEELAW